MDTDTKTITKQEIETSENNQQISTPLESYTPTATQLKWLDTAVELVSDSPTEIAAGCGMERTIWYKWLSIPGFEDWYYTEYKRRRRRWIPLLDSIGMRNARKDYNYWKDMNKKAGEALDEKTPQTVQVNNLIKIE